MNVIGVDDIAAVINVILGLIVFVLEFRIARQCRQGKWVYYLKSAAGLILAAAFATAIIGSFSGGSGLVPPEIGRPAVTIALTALAVGAIYNHKSGECP